MPTTPIREAEKLLDVLLEHYIDGDGYCEGKDRKRAIQAITKHTERAVAEAKHQTMIRELSWCLRNPRKSIVNRLQILKTQLEAKDE